jgi:hypothetical protein
MGRAARPECDVIAHAQPCPRAEARHDDMTAWFTPTAENYFGRIDKGDHSRGA